MLQAPSVQVSKVSQVAVQSKTCTANCSGHGVCLFQVRSSGASLSDCKVTDTSCSVYCQCSSSFSGVACSLSAAEMSAKQSVREGLLSGLLNVTGNSYSSTKSVSSWMNSLSTLVSNTYELNSKSVNLAYQVTSSIISSASSLSLSYEQTSSVVASIDSLSTGYLLTESMAKSRRLTSSTSNKTGLTYSSAALNVKALLQSYGSVVANDMVAGQASVGMIASHFRMSVSLVDSSGSDNNVSLAIPQTLAEQYTKTPVPSAQLASSSSTQSAPMSVSTIVMNSVLFGDPNLQSGVVMVHTNNVGASADTVKAVITLQNNAPIEFHSGDFSRRTLSTAEESAFSVTCAKGVKSSKTFLCPPTGLEGRGGGSTEIEISCDGTEAGVRKKYCPAKRLVSVCESLGSNSTGRQCSVRGFTSTNTTCVCSFRNDTASSTLVAAGGGRGGGGADAGGASVDIGSMLSFVAADMGATWTSADDLTLTNVADNWQVLVTVSVFGGLFLLAVFGADWLDRASHRIEVEESKKLQQQSSFQNKTSSKKRNEEKDFVALIDDSIPKTFSKDSLSVKIIREIKQFHRW